MCGVPWLDRQPRQFRNSENTISFGNYNSIILATSLNKFGQMHIFVRKKLTAADRK